MKPKSLKKTLTSINEQFMAHAKTCEMCAPAHFGVCKRGVELLLEFHSVIQAEVERDRRNPDRQCSLCQGSGWRQIESLNGNPPVARCLCAGGRRLSVLLTDGTSAAAGDV